MGVVVIIFLIYGVVQDLYHQPPLNPQPYLGTWTLRDSPMNRSTSKLLKGSGLGFRV